MLSVIMSQGGASGLLVCLQVGWWLPQSQPSGLACDKNVKPRRLACGFFLTLNYELVTESRGDILCRIIGRETNLCSFPLRRADLRRSLRRLAPPIRTLLHH